MAAGFNNIADLWVHTDYQELLQRHGLCSLDALLRTPGDVQLHKNSLERWRERVVLNLQTPQGSRRFFLKRYQHPPLRWQVDRLLTRCGSTAAVEWGWLQRLSRLGLRVPQLVAYGARRRGLAEIHSLLLTAEVPGESLERWLPAALASGDLDRTARRRLSDQLAALVARLHGAGFTHRDLYLSHIFINPQAAEELELYLIDLQRVIAPRWRRRRWIIKDLAALNYSSPAGAVTHSERLRWLKSYLQTMRLTSDHKRLIAEVLRKTERIARHSRKHGLG